MVLLIAYNITHAEINIGRTGRATYRDRESHLPGQGEPPTGTGRATYRDRESHLPGQGEPPTGTGRATYRDRESHLPGQGEPPTGTGRATHRDRESHLPGQGEPPTRTLTLTLTLTSFLLCQHSSTPLTPYTPEDADHSGLERYDGSGHPHALSRNLHQQEIG